MCKCSLYISTLKNESMCADIEKQILENKNHILKHDNEYLMRELNKAKVMVHGLTFLSVSFFTLFTLKIISNNKK